MTKYKELNMTGKDIMYAVNTASSLFNTGYNIHLQNRIFRREDNALQRAVLDAQKAGLSPLSVTGGANAGQIVSQSPVDFSQMNQLMQQQAELKLQQEQLNKQDQWHQNQIGVEQYNAETARINATTELLKVSEDIALKNKEFGQHVEEFVYKKINDEFNRRHQAELQSSQQQHDERILKLRYEAENDLQNRRFINDKARQDAQISVDLLKHKQDLTLRQAQFLKDSIIGLSREGREWLNTFARRKASSDPSFRAQFPKGVEKVATRALISALLKNIN